MRIGFVFDDSLDKSDGVQQYILQLGKWLSEKGHEVHYLVGQTIRHDLKNVHSLSRNVNVSFNHNRLSIPLPANKNNIRKLLLTYQFDVLHIQLPYSPQLAERVILSAQESVGVVGTFHILPYSTKERIGTKALATTLRRSIKRFDQIISVSGPSQKFAKKSFQVDSVIIPNPVDIEAFQSPSPKLKSETVQITFLGRFVERKGILQLLRAIKDLSDMTDQSYKLKIIGSGPLEKKVHRYVMAHKLESIIDLVGYIDEKDKPQYLKNSDIAIFPSIGGESFGIVLIEAMAAGAGVVVGGDNPGYKSVLKDKRTIFSPTNHTEFVTFLADMINNSKQRKQLHDYQQKLVKQFDINVVGADILNIYEEVIAKRKVYMNNKGNGIVPKT